MNKTTLIALGAIFLSLLSTALADNQVTRKGEAPRPGKTPAVTVKALYDVGFFDQRHHIDQLALKKLSACLSKELINHIEQCNKKIKVWLTNDENEGLKLPICEGSVCVSNYEGANTFEIGESTIKRLHAEVPILLSYSEAGTTFRWVDVAILRFVDGTWLLDDLLFDKRSSTLRERLKLEQ